MRILILGGTIFLGRHLVEVARHLGHEVTLFNRGRTNPDVFPDVQTIRGDRATDLALLQGGRWDAVIDTCGYLPEVVMASAEALRPAAPHYTFVSSISVYAHPVPSGADEGAPLQQLDPNSAKEFRPERYGALKALCEEAVASVYGDAALLVRSGLLIGPYDPTGRLGYWIERLAEGGEVLAPGSPTRRLQLIDARDMASWILRMVENGLGGTYNVTGPARDLTMADLLTAVASATNGSEALEWLPESFLLRRGVAPWAELPLWLPDELNGMLDVSIRRALDAGLAFRPLATSLRDMNDAVLREPTPTRALASGAGGQATLSRARERELLSLWRKTQSD